MSGHPLARSGKVANEISRLFTKSGEKLVFFITRSETIQKRWFLAHFAPKGMGFHPSKIYGKGATQSPDIEKSRNQFRDFLKIWRLLAFGRIFSWRKSAQHPKNGSNLFLKVQAGLLSTTPWRMRPFDHPKQVISLKKPNFSYGKSGFNSWAPIARQRVIFGF